MSFNNKIVGKRIIFMKKWGVEAASLAASHRHAPVWITESRINSQH